MKRIVLFAIGLTLVVGGMALTLSQWATLTEVVKAFAGPFLAVAGLVLLFSVSIKDR